MVRSPIPGDVIVKTGSCLLRRTCANQPTGPDIEPPGIAPTEAKPADRLEDDQKRTGPGKSWLTAAGAQRRSL